MYLINGKYSNSVVKNYPSLLIFRLAAFPITRFLTAGNKELFDDCSLLAQRERRVQCTEKHLAYHLNLLINHVNISRVESKMLGRVVRRLSSDQAMQEDERQIVNTILPKYHPRLTQLINRADDKRKHYHILSDMVEVQVDQELVRSAKILCQHCITVTPYGKALAHRDPVFFEKCVVDGQSSEFWAGKKGRLKYNLLIKILMRSTFRTTPRDWHTTVGALHADADYYASSVEQTDQFASVWVENIHGLRGKISQQWPGNRDQVLLSLTAIFWLTEDKAHFCVTHLEHPEKVSYVVLARSDFLEGILALLKRGAITFESLYVQLYEHIDNEKVDLLEGFIGHLVSIGVVQLSCSPSAKLMPWTQVNQLSQIDRQEDGKNKQMGYMDVYSRIVGHVSTPQLTSLQNAFALLARLSLLLDRTVRARDQQSGLIDNRTGEKPNEENPPELVKRKLVDILRTALLENNGEALSKEHPNQGIAETATTDTRQVYRSQSATWPLVNETSSAYGVLMSNVAKGLSGSNAYNINPDLLNELQLPQWDYPWPIDIMVRFARSGAGYDAVFDEGFAAGSMDARFLHAGMNLGWQLDQFTFYRRFLKSLEQQFDYRFIEILFPPLSLGAANAVRRRQYTSYWTGDLDAETYFESLDTGSHYVSLEELFVHQKNLTKRVFWQDKLVFPMYHATRLPISPWNIITDTLLNAVPYQMRWTPRNMCRLLDAFPNAEHSPQLQVANGLVVSCEQWRLPERLPWQPNDRLVFKIQCINRLRKSLDLPRVVFLSAGIDRRPSACDLYNIDSVRLFEAVYKQGGDILAIAMTPEPESLLVTKNTGQGVDRFQSTTLIRFPLTESPEEMSQRVGPLLSIGV